MLMSDLRNPVNNVAALTPHLCQWETCRVGAGLFITKCMEARMRIRLILALVLLLPIMAVAQIEVVGGTRSHTPAAAPAGDAAPGFSLPGGFKAPEGLLDDFWSDPATAGELHLSDAQRKQLQDAALAQ